MGTATASDLKERLARAQGATHELETEFKRAEAAERGEAEVEERAARTKRQTDAARSGLLLLKATLERALDAHLKAAGRAASPGVVLAGAQTLSQLEFLKRALGEN